MRDINNCFTKKEKRRKRKKALTRVIKQRAREIGRLRCLPRERSIHEEHVLSYFPLKLYDSPYIGTCVSYPVKLEGERDGGTLADNTRRERPAFNTWAHVFINRLIPLNFLKRLHPGENEKSFLVGRCN